MSDKNRFEEIAAKAWALYMRWNTHPGMDVSPTDAWVQAKRWVNARDEKLAEAEETKHEDPDFVQVVFREDGPLIDQEPLAVQDSQGREIDCEWRHKGDQVFLRIPLHAKKAGLEEVYEKALKRIQSLTQKHPDLVLSQQIHSVCWNSLRVREDEDIEEAHEDAKKPGLEKVYGDALRFILLSSSVMHQVCEDALRAHDDEDGKEEEE